MKKLFMLAALAVLCVVGVSGAAVNSRNWPMRPFFTNQTLGYNGSAVDSTIFVFGKGVSAENFENGVIAIRMWRADTAGTDTAGVRADMTKDSLLVQRAAIEVFVYTQAGFDSLGVKYRQQQMFDSTGARSGPNVMRGSVGTIGDTLVATPVVGDSTRYALVDMDDSNDKLDGFFCTTMDSTALSTAGQISGGQVWPAGVSSRIVYGRAVSPVGALVVPGQYYVNNPVYRYRIRLNDNSDFNPDRTGARDVWFYLPLTDAYGGVLRGFHVLNIGVLDRALKYNKYKVSAWLLGASD